MCDLSDSGMPGRWEQLWARRTGANEFVICAIPFFAYGLALGDRVTAASATGGFDQVIDSVVERARNAVLHIAFREDAEQWEVQEWQDELIEHVKRLKLPYEIHVLGYVAISCPEASPEYEEMQKVLHAFTLLEWSTFELAAPR
jgi:hypothetical protein